MSESTFSADLDALVRGETIASNDEFTRFVTDLYGEEQNVTMPNALKLRIANDLGLAAAGEPTTVGAPVSRRTLRAAESPRRSSRPWAIAFAVAAAILLALTGILRWGMPTGNEEPDNRFLFASPAVPTVSATPSASPEANEWIVPYTDADCPEDELLPPPEWFDVIEQRATTHDPDTQRMDEPYGVPEIADAEVVATLQRQSMACQNRGDSPEDRLDALPIDSPRKAWENSAEGYEAREEINNERLERSKSFSSYAEDELGLTPDDLVYHTDGQSGQLWEPENAVQMADGRIALIPGWSTNSDGDISGFQGFVPVWQNIDGEWLLDEELFFCIGDCDDYWFQLEMFNSSQSTPVASPESSPVADQSWMQPITPEECVTEESGELPDASPEDFDALPDREYNLVGPADPADAYAANDVARQYLACDYPTSLLSDRAAVENALSTDEFSPYTVVTLDRQLANGISVSAQMEELGVLPVDMMVQADIESTGFFPPNPEMALVLDDGRILIMTVAISGSPDDAQVSVGSTLSLVLENGEWKVDDQLPVCIGPCDDLFADLEPRYMDALWLYPISAEECDRNDYLPNGLTTEQSAAIRGRQYQACEMNGVAENLQGPEYRLTEGEDAREMSEEIGDLYDQGGEVPGSLQRIARQELWPHDMTIPNDPWTAFQPDSVVTLSDGRIAVLETTAISNQTDNRVSIRTTPVITTALVWNVDGDTWLLDEEVTVCLGNCDAFWGEEPVITPVSTPMAIVIPETCEPGDEFVADFITSDRMVTIVRPGPSHASGVQIGVLGFNTPVQYLCEAEETTNSTVDRMEEGQRWLLVRAEDGTEGWIREVDVREREP